MATYNNSEGVWRTIGGRKVFIRNGQSLSDAMKESGKFKKQNVVETSKTANNDTHKTKFNNGMDLPTRLAENRDLADKVIADEEYVDIATHTYNGDDIWVENERTGKKFKLGPYDTKETIESGIKETFNDTPKERTYNDIDKEWKETQSKIEKDWEEFGTTSVANEKRLNELSKERDAVQFKSDEVKFQKGKEPKVDLNENAKEYLRKEDASVKKMFGEDSDFYKQYKQQHEAQYGKDYLSAGIGKSNDTSNIDNYNDKATASFGKIDYNGTGRKSNEVSIDMELKDGVFKASGSIKNARGTDSISGGQNIDEIADMMKDNKDVQEIRDLWHKYHLNDMHAGTEKQEEALAKKFGGVNANKYDEQVEYLKSIDLYEDNGYRFGSGWLKREIPVEDKKRIIALIDKYNGKSDTSNDWVRDAFNQYKKEHPNTKMTFDKFKKQNK